LADTNDEQENRAVELLDALARSDVEQVVFFITTSHFEKNDGRERVESYAAAGHLIANHSHSHWWANRTDTDQYIEDIYRAEERLEGFDNRRPWFRFPFLDEGRETVKRDAIRAAMADRALMNGYVTIDNYDWYVDSKWKEAVDAGREVDVDALRKVYVEMLVGAANFYNDLAETALGSSPAHVLLLHENDVAASFVDDLVVALRADGWSIIGPDEAYADPIAANVPETLLTGQGLVAALAIEAGVDNRTLTHLAIEEDQIDALLAERNVFIDKN
jgi:peptidoglycan/xylan/chitin deacetylase (PgdA/CDA1 family)